MVSLDTATQVGGESRGQASEEPLDIFTLGFATSELSGASRPFGYEQINTERQVILQSSRATKKIGPWAGPWVIGWALFCLFSDAAHTPWAIRMFGV